MNDYSYLDKLTCYCDIHYHIDGSLSVQNIRELADLNGIALLDSDDELRKKIECDPDCHDLVQFLTKFAFPCSLLQTKESLILATKNILKEAQKEGNIYIELRYAPQLHCEKGMSQEEAVLAVIEGCKNSPIYCNVILCMMRGNGEETYKNNLETVILAHKYLNKGVAGIDLAGAESLYPTKDFESLFRKAYDLGVPFTIHAGEADGYESVMTALDFGTKRIGHGVRSVENEQLLLRLKKERILLEICPSSNIKTAIFKDYKEIPIRDFINNGILFSINTDDKSIIGTNIKKEFINVSKAHNLDKTDVKNILLNTIKNSFACQDIIINITNIISKQLCD